MNFIRHLVENSELYQFHNAEFNDQWIVLHPDDVENFIVDERDRHLADQDGENEAAPDEAAPNEAAPNEAQDDWEEDLDDEQVHPGAEITLMQDQNEINAADQNIAYQYAPGQNNRPIGLLMDADAEYLAFPKNYGGIRPNLPPRTTYGAQIKYEIRHFDRRFAESTEHLLYKSMKLAVHKVASSSQMALRQAHFGNNQVTANDLLDEGIVADIVRYDVGKYKSWIV